MNTARTSTRRQKKKTAPKRSHKAKKYELTNTLKGFKSRLDAGEEKISELKDRAHELTQRSTKRKF